MNEFGEKFMLKHPNVLIDVIPFPTYLDVERQYSAVRDIIHQDRPDVIFLTSDIDAFRERVHEGVLLELDSLIQRDQELRDHYHQGVLNAIRDYGGGSIYGLSGRFNRYGIFYNVELFRERNLTPPVNQMSWRELMELARQFKGAINEKNEPIIGLSMPLHASVLSVIADYAATEQLYLTNPAQGVLFDQPGWKTVVEDVVTGLREGYLSVPAVRSGQDEAAYSDFNAGNIAMMLADNVFIGSMQDVEWDVVTEPVNKLYPDAAYKIRINMYGIHKETPVLPAAWELLKYIILHEQEAYPAAKSLLYAYQPYDDVVKEHKQVNFYRFQGVLEPPREAVSPDFFTRFQAIAESWLLQAVTDRIDINTAIQHIQSEGQRLWLAELGGEEEGMKR